MCWMGYLAVQVTKLELPRRIAEWSLILLRSSKNRGGSWSCLSDRTYHPLSSCRDPNPCRCPKCNCRLTQKYELIAKCRMLHCSRTYGTKVQQRECRCHWSTCLRLLNALFEFFLSLSTCVSTRLIWTNREEKRLLCKVFQHQYTQR